LTYVFLLDADGHVLLEDMIFFPEIGREWMFSGVAMIDGAGDTLVFSMREHAAQVLRAGYPKAVVRVWAPWALSQDGRVLAGIDEQNRLCCFDISSPPPKQLLHEGGFRGRPVLVRVAEDHQVRVVLHDPARQWVGVTQFAVP
jgi:hypothetical protein